MKNRTWIIIFAIVISLCAVVYFLISNGFSSTSTVGIYQNGELVEKIDLNSVTTEREITLKGDCGENTILVSHGKIKMLSAECPDKVCVNHGELAQGGTPIVCLPNKVVIKWENSGQSYDAKTGV